MERWIQTCRRELLDRTLIWNLNHLRHALHEYASFYNEHRPHRTLEQAEQPGHITSSTSVMQGGDREGLGQGHGRAADQAAQVAGVGVHLAAVHAAVSVSEDLRQLGG